MKIIQNEIDGIAYVTVKGRAETQLTHEFEVAIKEIVEGDNRNLLLDLGALNYLRSSVLRVILNAAKDIERKGGKVVLCSLNAYVREVFEGNCFEDAIAISDTVESGLSALLSLLKAA
ncbi:MAG: STAS domain-containing protein [Desulfobacterales bacterium]|nr:MAG: STAS domain-containing protein [Desulfobacterales bacterium]